MAKDIDELRLIVDLATDKGKMEQQNSQLNEERAQMQHKLAEQEALIAQQQAYITMLEGRVRELEALACGCEKAAAQPATQVVLMAQYLLLSGAKTKAYVKNLNDTQRMFAGHMLIHTLAEGTPQALLDQVTEMTQLEGAARQERLASAIEEVATKPTTSTNIYPQPGSTANVGCEMQKAEFVMKN